MNTFSVILLFSLFFKDEKNLNIFVNNLIINSKTNKIILERVTLNIIKPRIIPSIIKNRNSPFVVDKRKQNVMGEITMKNIRSSKNTSIFEFNPIFRNALKKS